MGRNRQKIYAITSILAFVTGLALFIYFVSLTKIFHPNYIMVSGIATTGPDFRVSAGQIKLILMSPDSVSDVTGIMLTKNSDKYVSDYINKNTQFWYYTDYYILGGKIVGGERSDGARQHPLINVTSISHIDKLVFNILVVIIFCLLLISGLFYAKHRLLTHSNK